MKYDVELEVRFIDSDPSWDKVFTVNARVGDDTATDEEDERIFYYYETFEEILENSAVDFTVLSINGRNIDEICSSLVY
jgi:hypothetical protein